MSEGLRLTGLSKRYGQRPVIHSLDLTVKSGELLVLVGPSGSGKSTVLRLIAGLIAHDTGEINVAGKNVGDLPADKRDIAMVFQSYALFPHLSVRENLAFGMHARREPMVEGQKRIEEIAAQLQLSALLERYPPQLSGGERQRVALARAMLRQPRLFLLDEPLSNLDAQLRVHTRAEILRLHRRLKTTMVMVTHDQIEALSVGDRIGVLRDGKLEDLGTPKELYEQPATEFVAGFLGSPAMNLLDGHIEAGELHFCGLKTALQGEASGFSGAVRVGTPTRARHTNMLGSNTRSAQALDFQAELDVIEFVGDQRYLELNWQGQTLTARTEPDHAGRIGTAIPCWLDPTQLHLFAQSDGRRIGALERASP